MSDLRMPIVTTLHTVLREPSDDQHRVLCQVAELSSRLVVMSELARGFLRDVYGVPESKIDLIAHGIPDMPFVDPNFYKDQFDVEGKFVALTFGLLSPNKGIEVMLRAMPAILREFPDFVYVVVGATHPNLVREQGERYRISLERLAKELGIKPNVSFYNRFLEIDELIEFIGMADIYITPYLNPAQIVSGTLAYAFGCGKAVISTPYWYAKELLADGRGGLVPFDDPAALAREVVELLRDEPRRHAMRKKAYMLGREMIWSHVAHLYMETFARARRGRQDVPYKPLAVRTLAEQPMDLPGWRLDHLVRMTDSAGLIQHATSTIPHFAEGYCTDDNARALLLTVLLEQLGQGSGQVHRLATVYAAFLNYAFDRKLGRFRNFFSFDAGGWRTSARTTATAEPSGRWGPAWGDRGGGTCRSGRRSSSTRRCRRSPRRPRRAAGRRRSWASATTCIGSAAPGPPARCATPSPTAWSPSSIDPQKTSGDGSRTA